jgi:hypothetical protein
MSPSISDCGFAYQDQVSNVPALYKAIRMVVRDAFQ